MAIVLGVVLVVAAALRLPLFLRVLIAMAALGYFVLLVGPEPSVLRASVMGRSRSRRCSSAAAVGGRRSWRSA